MKPTEDTVNYAIHSFSFVLPLNGSFTFQAWADEIEKIYSTSNLRTSVMVNEIRSWNGVITRQHGRSALTFNQ